MYRKDTEEWLKHIDFIILDLICLQVAYVLAYAASGYSFNLYATLIYRNMAVFLELANLLVIFTYGTMKNVLKRGHYQEFRPVSVPDPERAGFLQDDDHSHGCDLSGIVLCGQRTLEMVS